MVRHPADWTWSSYCTNIATTASPAWLDTLAVYGYLLGREVNDGNDMSDAAARYATLVAQGANVMLWETALRQQIYLGDDSFVVRMQSLLDPKRTLDVDVPHVQRRTRPMSITDYLASYDRDEAIGLAYREGRHTRSAIAREPGLSVARISRLIAVQEAKSKA